MLVDFFLPAVLTTAIFWGGYKVFKSKFWVVMVFVVLYISAIFLSVTAPTYSDAHSEFIYNIKYFFYERAYNAQYIPKTLGIKTYPLYTIVGLTLSAFVYPSCGFFGQMPITLLLVAIISIVTLVAKKIIPEPEPGDKSYKMSINWRCWAFFRNWLIISLALAVILTIMEDRQGWRLLFDGSFSYLLLIHVLYFPPLLTNGIYYFRGGFFGKSDRQKEWEDRGYKAFNKGVNSGWSIFGWGAGLFAGASLGAIGIIPKTIKLFLFTIFYPLVLLDVFVTRKSPKDNIIIRIDDAIS